MFNSKVVKTLLIAILAMGLFVSGKTPAFSQVLPPETFLITRHIGLGGTTYADYIAIGRDDNPALLFERGENASVKVVHVPDSVLPNTNMEYLQANTGVSDNWIVEVAGAVVKGNKSSLSGSLHLRENGLGLQIAHRVNKRLSLGFGTAFIATHTQAEVPGLGGFNQRSNPSAFGGRLGAQYKASNNLGLEMTYDHYKDKETTVPYGFIASLVPESSSQFLTKKLTLGGTYKTKYIEFDIFHTNLSITSDTYSFQKDFWHGGVTVPIKNFSLYGGLYDGKTSYGIGYRKGPHRVVVAVSDQNKIYSSSANRSYYMEYSYNWK